MAIRNFASEAFGPGGGGVLVPRQKFHFTLVLLMADQAVQFTRVSTVTQASYSFDTQIANQYNKKRVIQTKVNYDPITVQFYDTHDNQWHNIFRRYIAYYYNGSNGIEGRQTLEGRETAVPFFQTDLGFTPNADRYFFPRISIVQHGQANKHRETLLINPIITEMRGDNLDYSDSQPVQYTVTFQPESVQTLNVGTQFNVDTSVDATDFNVLVGGFGDADTIEPGLGADDASVSSATIATFDTLADALLGGSNLQVGSIVDISGVDAIVDATSDGRRFFLDIVTGSPLQ